MKPVSRSEGYAINRTYYLDSDGVIVSKTDEEDVSALIQYNQDMASQHNPYSNEDCRVVAEVPVSLYYKWLVEEGVPGWSTEEALDGILEKKLRDPEYKYLLTVPSTYEIMRTKN